MFRRLLPGFSALAVASTVHSAVAQTPPTPATPPARQQIILNGQSFYGDWTQWQSGSTARTGISDAALVQVLGGQLLSTSDVTQQPIQWFSNSLAVLPTRLGSTARYLDITQFARSKGWQIDANNNVLNISTQRANVTSIQQEIKPWGDRITITLDRPTPWQADSQSLEYVLTVNAQLPENLGQVFQPSPTTKIRSLSIESAPNLTRLRIGVPWRVRPQVTTQGNQIIFDVGVPYLVEREIAWAPGLRWKQQFVTIASGQYPAISLEVNPRQPNLKIQPILPNPEGVPGTAPVARTARDRGAIAAINGGFFSRSTQLPLGAIRQNNQWLSSPILTRGVVGWNSDGNLRIDRLVLQETAIVTTRNLDNTQATQRFPLVTLNSGYPQAGISRYTPAWGATYTTLNDNEILVTVQNHQVTDQKAIEKTGTSTQIPADGYLLVLRSNRTAATAFTPTSTIQLDASLNPPDFANYANIIGAGPLLIQNGQVVLNAKGEGFSDAFIAEKAARSAIGQRADGTILIVAVQDRNDGISATLTDIAEIMQKLGAVNALNLDGGSSTTLYLGGQILDRSPSSAARVHSGIGVFLQP